MSATETKTLTHSEYLQALGLGLLIRETYARLRSLEAALGELLYYGIVSDEIYSDSGPDIDGLLSRLDISVEAQS